MLVKENIVSSVESKVFEEKIKKHISKLIKEIPEDLKVYFFDRTIEDLLKIEQNDFEHEFIAKQIYTAYIVGTAVGKMKSKNKK